MKQDNNICDVPVKIYPYFKSLDTILYGGNRPHLKLPEPITVSVHPAIREFILKKEQISSIKDQMSSQGVLTMAGLKPIMENILERAKNQMERKNNSVTEYMEISPALYSLLEQDGLKVLFLHICALTTTKKLTD